MLNALTREQHNQYHPPTVCKLWTITPCSGKERANNILCITASNTNRFVKFFHCHNLKESCNKTIIKYSTWSRHLFRFWNLECPTEAANLPHFRPNSKGRNSKSEGLSQGPRLTTPCTSYRGFVGVLWAFPSGVQDKVPAAKNFDAFWVFQVSCPAVLICKTVCVGPLYRSKLYNLMHLPYMPHIICFRRCIHNT